ncbi:MAG TPA: NAD(P)-dependent alcohol dehydrogenase [Pseudomonadaceae bacterium]|nr:NAD(P)-dependent alcohol dehydrogenase [Pseudomonadaceae bacterium]
MKAFVIKAGSNSMAGLAKVERDQPVAGPGEILIKMKAASLNYRDLAVPMGQYIGGPVPRDIVALSDGCGEVIATGEGVTRFKHGDRAAATFFKGCVDKLPNPMQDAALGAIDVDGVLAEYIVVKEHDAVHVPANLNWLEGATLPCAGLTAWNALMVAGRPLQLGDTVLLLGTGGVSMQALLFAKAAGARVIITSSSDEKLAKAREYGADLLINYRKTPEWHEEVLALTGGRGVDCVVEVGGAGTVGRSMKAICHGGKIALIGILTQEGDTNPRTLMFKAGSMHGIFVGNRAMFEQMNRTIEFHNIHPLIDRVFPFDEASQAYAYMQSQAQIGKIVISFE